MLFIHYKRMLFIHYKRICCLHHKRCLHHRRMFLASHPTIFASFSLFMIWLLGLFSMTGIHLCNIYFLNYTGSQFMHARNLIFLHWLKLLSVAGKPTRKLSLWPSGISSRLGRNRLRVRFQAMSDIYPMFIEPTDLGPFEVLWVHMAWHKNCVENTDPI